MIAGRGSPRAFGVLLVALACVAWPRGAAAALRVYDAALPAGALDKPAPAVPPPPPEYLTEDLGWLEIVYHPSTRDRVRPLLGRAAAIRAEIGALLGREPFAERAAVRIARHPAELENLAPPGLAGAGAVYGDLRLAVLEAGSLDAAALEEALRHRLAHLALHEATGGAALPRWLHEGFAVHAAGDHAGLRAQALCLGALRGRLLALAELEAHLPHELPQASVAYAEAADFARYLLQGPRRAHFAAFVELSRGGAPFDQALARAYGADLGSLELGWREDVARRYGFAPVLAGALLALLLPLVAFAALRRMRRRRVQRPPPYRRVRPDPELRTRVVRTPTQILAARGARARDGGDVDADVPKVEHDGRWYTLH